MTLPATSKPALTPDDAEALLAERFGITGTLRVLDGYRDLNFRVDADDGRRFVFKIYNPLEARAYIDLQDVALRRLADAGIEGCPQPVATDEAGESIIRLLTWVEGKSLADVRPHNAELLEDVGRLVGRVDRTVADLDLGDANREIEWDPRHAYDTVTERLSDIDDPSRRALITRRIGWAQGVATRLAGLPTSVVHHDANEWNVLVTTTRAGQSRATGLIDFGDLRHTWTASGAGVTVAYGVLGTRNPLTAARAILRGYHAEHPLAPEEIEAVWELARLRIMVSVSMAAQQRKLAPDNEYLSVSEAPGWRALERMDEIHPRFAVYAMRDACGLPGCPGGPKVATWLDAHAHDAAPVLPWDLRSTSPHVLDLSVDAPGFEHEGSPTSVIDQRLAREVSDAGAQVGVGRYDEVRRCYTSDVFATSGDGFAERRTVHLGVDLFVPAGTPVHAPYDGHVWSVADNEGRLDYGPTIILHHTPPAGPEFWTLYGHLDRASIDGIEPGRPVARGDKIAAVGPFPENGDWPTHVHFQVITDVLDQRGDFVGVAPPSLRALWRTMCPDPTGLLGLGPDAVAPAVRATEDLARHRGALIGANLSLSYRRPLSIVRGRGSYLFDTDGQAYLDGVNNVCHVGHSHPRVVRALADQATVLNTNTRYLHPNLTDYAERLTNLFPDPLEVVFFCCSGSEANELALRLARTATGREGVIVLDAAYHGNTGALVDLSPYKHDGPGGRGAPAWAHVVPLPDPYRGQEGPPREGVDLGAAYARYVEELVAKERPAAFLAEALPGCGGQIELPAGYLAAAFSSVRAAGGVCIADEVQIGFGRMGSHWWGFETHDVVPDIVPLGKPIGNGHPLAAVVTTRAIADAFNNGMEWFNTFGGNPVSCAVGLAVLDVMEDLDLRGNALRVGARLKDGLTALMGRHPLIGDVRGRGLFLGAELVTDRDAKTPATAEAAWVTNRMRDLGILLSTDGPDANVLKFKPPLVWTESEADHVIATLDRVLGEDALTER